MYMSILAAWLRAPMNFWDDIRNSCNIQHPVNRNHTSFHFPHRNRGAVRNGDACAWAVLAATHLNRGLDRGRDFPAQLPRRFRTLRVDRNDLPDVIHRVNAPVDRKSTRLNSSHVALSPMA